MAMLRVSSHPPTRLFAARCASRGTGDNGEGRLAMQPPPTLHTGLHLTWKQTRVAQRKTHTNVTAILTPTPYQCHRAVATIPSSLANNRTT